MRRKIVVNLHQVRKFRTIFVANRPHHWQQLHFRGHYLVLLHQCHCQNNSHPAWIWSWQILNWNHRLENGLKNGTTRALHCEIQGISLVDGFFELGLTERKHAINFNLKVDSDQGRLPIWYSTTKIQKNILQHSQNLCQNHNTHYIKLKKMVISK